MTEQEKNALILAGISMRSEHYLQVKSLLHLPLQTISTRTRFTVYFIKQCREIAGWERQKTRNNENHDTLRAEDVEIEVTCEDCKKEFIISEIQY